MRHLRSRLPRPMALIAIFLLGACDDSSAPNPPARIETVAQVPLNAAVGDSLTDIVIRITEQNGKPLSAVPVTFSITSGGGSIATTDVRTDGRGLATPGTWRLGTRVGENVLAAHVAGLPAHTIQVTARPGPAASMRAYAGDAQSAVIGNTLPTSPQVLVIDAFDNAVANIPVRFETAAGSGTIGTVEAQTNTAGLASAGTWTLGITPGLQQVTASAPNLSPIVFSALATVAQQSDPCADATTLAPNFALGGLVRVRVGAFEAPRCLTFDPQRNDGQQYLLLFENLPRSGEYGGGLFPGIQMPTVFSLRLIAEGTAGTHVTSENPAPVASERRVRTHSWNFGAGSIYEIEPELPASGVVPATQLLRSGLGIDINSAAADPVVGDTLLVFMEALDRLSIPRGNQRAVVRYISGDLVIAEDIRLGTLKRSNDGYNAPIAVQDMAAIASAYALQPRIQSDLLFESRFNRATELTGHRRIVAVHTVMNSADVWGYTFSSTNTFLWDYWVGTDGRTKGLNQHPLRNAQNLFTHEVAHTRHWGLLERAGRTSLRGNRWLVEGFARFAERLPIAAYLLNANDPSRVQNVILPRYPEFGNSYFRDDVPTFLNAGHPMFDGYQSSSFVFDYFADQIARSGRDWRKALTQLVTAGGVEGDLDAVVSSWIPGMTFQELFTRARIALYLDDIGTPGLPDWTQYHQFQLRASRPAGNLDAGDPRSAWPHIIIGSSLNDVRDVPVGGAIGYVIDITSAPAPGRIRIEAQEHTNGVFSITRIR